MCVSYQQIWAQLRPYSKQGGKTIIRGKIITNDVISAWECVMRIFGDGSASCKQSGQTGQYLGRPGTDGRRFPVFTCTMEDLWAM